MPKPSLMFAWMIAALSLPLPASAADKISGVNKDFQRLSETSVTVPDKPGHTFKQNTVVWKSISSDPRLGEAWTSAVGQQDNIGAETTERGYATNHYQSGDVSYISFEGIGKTTKKDGGDYETAGQGKFTFLGGTGKFKSIKGAGTYTCKFTPKGGQCDWDAEAEM